MLFAVKHILERKFDEGEWLLMLRQNNYSEKDECLKIANEIVRKLHTNCNDEILLNKLLIVGIDIFANSIKDS